MTMANHSRTDVFAHSANNGSLAPPRFYHDNIIGKNGGYTPDIITIQMVAS